MHVKLYSYMDNFLTALPNSLLVVYLVVLMFAHSIPSIRSGFVTYIRQRSVDCSLFSAQRVGATRATSTYYILSLVWHLIFYWSLRSVTVALLISKK